MEKVNSKQKSSIISVKNSVWFPLIVFLFGTLLLGVLSYYLGGRIAFFDADISGMIPYNLYNIIWPIILTILSISIYLQFISKKSRPKIEIKENLISFYIHFIFVFFWPLAIFRLNSLIAGAILIGIAVITGIYVVYRFFNSSIFSGILIIIYELWLMYIFYINFALLIQL